MADSNYDSGSSFLLKVLIFAQTKRRVDQLAGRLSVKG